MRPPTLISLKELMIHISKFWRYDITLIFMINIVIAYNQCQLIGHIVLENLNYLVVLALVSSSKGFDHMNFSNLPLLLLQLVVIVTSNK